MITKVWKRPCRKNASVENRLTYLENCIDGYIDENGQFELQEFVSDFIELRDALQKSIPNLLQFLDENPIYADNKITSLLLGLITTPKPESQIFADFADCLNTKGAVVPQVDNGVKQFSSLSSCPELVKGTRQGLQKGDKVSLYVSEVGGWLPVEVLDLLDTEDKQTVFKNETVGLRIIIKPEIMLEWLPSEGVNLPVTTDDAKVIQAVRNKEIWK